MYCKHCGNPMEDVAAVCVYCGVARGQGTNFCANCGTQLSPGSVYCMHCGMMASNIPIGAQQKSKIAAGLLGIFLGGLGIHNFYLGYTNRAIAQLLISVLSCGMLAAVSSIWGLVEGIQILTGSINVDANGVPLGE